MDEPDARDKQVLGPRLSDRAEEEAELLDGLHLEGFPEGEQKRRAEWLKLPRATRASIWRLHSMLLHKPTPVMIQTMKGAGMADEVIQGVKFFKCSDCLGLPAPKKRSQQ